MGQVLSVRNNLWRTHPLFAKSGVEGAQKTADHQYATVGAELVNCCFGIVRHAMRLHTFRQTDHSAFAFLGLFLFFPSDRTGDLDHLELECRCEQNSFRVKLIMDQDYVFALTGFRRIDAFLKEPDTEKYILSSPPSSSTDSLISTQDVSATWSSKSDFALQVGNLSFGKGLNVIFGPVGSGKTCLLQTLLGETMYCEILCCFAGFSADTRGQLLAS